MPKKISEETNSLLFAILNTNCPSLSLFNMDLFRTNYMAFGKPMNCFIFFLNYRCLDLKCKDGSFFLNLFFVCFRAKIIVNEMLRAKSRIRHSQECLGNVHSQSHSLFFLWCGERRKLEMSNLLVFKCINNMDDACLMKMGYPFIKMPMYGTKWGEIFCCCTILIIGPDSWPNDGLSTYRYKIFVRYNGTSCA
jgi:hypothetical protein